MDCRGIIIGDWHPLLGSVGGGGGRRRGRVAYLSNSQGKFSINIDDPGCACW